ncbi:MAG TPA: hypothetical protein PKB09_02125 [Candidatus Saccharibacteria bacterium]|nr:hypothetical protein [Candidatus Saccharibacteria bacterium]
MNKLKVLLGSSVASFALVAGVALPAAAQTPSTTVTTDASTNVSVSGDCSAAFVGDNYQIQSNGTAQGNIDVDLGVNLGVGGNLGSGSNDQANNQGGSQSNTNTTTQTQTGNSFDADCSTTNVTNVTKTVAAEEEKEVVAQVSSAPQGGVHAGFGSTATESSSTVALVGLTGSLSVLGLGLRFLKGEL